MLFPSAIFLLGFLPLFFAGYLWAPPHKRNLVLTFASLVFYAWGAPKFVFILIASSAIDFWIAQELQAAGDKRRLLLQIGLVTNIFTLFLFKYFNFFVANVVALFEAAGLQLSIPWQLALPIGLSFFTFQKISFLLDVYRKDSPPPSRFIDYLLFVSLFPQLIAGPIVRYKSIANQIRDRASEINIANFVAGWHRFVWGLAKKVVVADGVASLVDHAFATSELDSGLAWLGLLAFAVQIYFDFSGYSDMALGLGRMMGFTLPENFRSPYAAVGFRDFWRRWHITLGAWMKDYLYIPLGGNRASLLRTAINLWVVFLLSGLWHGANWTFVIWGAAHGLFISFEYVLDRSKPKAGMVKRVFTFLVVVLLWVLFRASDLSSASHYYSALVSFSNVNFQWPAPRVVFLLLFGLVSSQISLHHRHYNSLFSITWNRLSWLKMIGFVALFLFCLGIIGKGAGQPFIYFQF